jgi:ABC-type Fe3+ transport system permease subunit
MFFAIPGIILGLGFGLMLNAGFRVALFSVTWNYTTYNLPMEAYTMGIFIGIIMPVVSNILPIQRAIGKNLRSSLDMNHRS